MHTILHNIIFAAVTTPTLSGSWEHINFVIGITSMSCDDHAIIYMYNVVFGSISNNTSVSIDHAQSRP